MPPLFGKIFWEPPQYIRSRDSFFFPTRQSASAVCYNLPPGANAVMRINYNGTGAPGFQQGSELDPRIGIASMADYDAEADDQFLYAGYFEPPSVGSAGTKAMGPTSTTNENSVVRLRYPVIDYSGDRFNGIWDHLKVRVSMQQISASSTTYAASIGWMLLTIFMRLHDIFVATYAGIIPSDQFTTGFLSGSGTISLEGIYSIQITVASPHPFDHEPGDPDLLFRAGSIRFGTYAPPI